MTKEALKLALEALEEPKEHIAKQRRLEAITAIKEALAQEQEPVAWMVWGENNVPSLTFKKPSDKYVFDSLYTTPPKRKPLTDEDVERIVREARVGEHGIGYTIARAIEATHGIKE